MKSRKNINIVIPGEKKKNKQTNNQQKNPRPKSLPFFLTEHIWTSVHFMLLQVASMKIDSHTAFCSVNLSELIQQRECQLTIKVLCVLRTDLTIAVYCFPLHEYLDRKRDTENSTKDRVQPANLFFLWGFVGKKVLSMFQSTGWERKDWKRNGTACKLRLFCKESLKTDRNLMRSFLWCHVRDLGMTLRCCSRKTKSSGNYCHIW